MAKSALWIMVGFFVMISLHSSHALPFYPPAAAYNDNRHKDYLVEIENPDEVLELLAKLGQSILRAHEGSNTKRGLDLGLGRGFSGSQAAKHLMGLAAANFAAGPGKKKRVLGNTDLSYGIQDMNMMDNSNSNEWSQSNKE